jgi:hypothetical protein
VNCEGWGREELYFIRFDTKNAENLLNFSTGRNIEKILKIYKLTGRQTTITKYDRRRGLSY